MIHVAQVQGRVPFKETQDSQATQIFRTLFFCVSPKTGKGTQRTAPTALLSGPSLSSSCLSQSCFLELLSSQVPRTPSLYPPPQACQASPSCFSSASCLPLPPSLLLSLSPLAPPPSSACSPPLSASPSPCFLPPPYSPQLIVM